MKNRTSLIPTFGAVALLLVGCGTPSKQSYGPFPNDYESIVHNYVAPTFKHPDRLEWRSISFPRQGSHWGGVLFGGANPCWVVDVTADEKNDSGRYFAYQRTLFIKNGHVIGSRTFVPDGARFITVGRRVSFQEVTNLPPFNATVQNVSIDHPFFHNTTVDILLRRTDNGEHFDLAFPSANQSVLGFARSLHLGQTYSFPQAFGDYTTSLSSNAKGPMSISSPQ